MSDKSKELMAELRKSKAEFEIATMCVAKTLQAIYERLDKVETWITTNQKNLPERKT